MTMLDRAINGREVIAYVSGQIAPYDKRSNLYKSIIAHGYKPEDIDNGIIDIAVGAHGYNYSDGFKMAIVKTA